MDMNQIAKRILDEATGDTQKIKPPPVKNQAAVELGKLGGKKGGAARAKALTPEKRKEISQKAVAARKENSALPTATHIGELKIGELTLPCAVLPDGSRVIAQGGIATAFGPVLGGYQLRKKNDEEHTGVLPPFLVASSLKPFIDNDLRTLVSFPKKYKDPRGGPLRMGVDASLLPRICEVWLKANDSKALTVNRQRFQTETLPLSRIT